MQLAVALARLHVTPAGVLHAGRVAGTGSAGVQGLARHGRRLEKEVDTSVTVLPGGVVAAIVTNAAIAVNTGAGTCVQVGVIVTAVGVCVALASFARRKSAGINTANVRLAVEKRLAARTVESLCVVVTDAAILLVVKLHALGGMTVARTSGGDAHLAQHIKVVMLMDH